jgi:hypothetical protein
MQTHSKNHQKPSTAGGVTNLHYQPHENDTLQSTETIHRYNMGLWNNPEGIPGVPLLDTDNNIIIRTKKNCVPYR